MFRQFRISSFVSFVSFNSLVSCSRVYNLFTLLLLKLSLDSFCGGISSAGKINLRFLIFVGVSWRWWSTGQCWTARKSNKHHNDSNNNNSFILLCLSSNNCKVYLIFGTEHSWNDWWSSLHAQTSWRVEGELSYGRQLAVLSPLLAYAIWGNVLWETLHFHGAV